MYYIQKRQKKKCLDSSEDSSEDTQNVLLLTGMPHRRVMSVVKIFAIVTNS